MPTPPHFPPLSPAQRALNYGKLEPSNSEPDPHTPTRTRFLWRWLAASAIALLLVAAAIAALAVVKSRKDQSNSGQSGSLKPTKAITRVCGMTQYQSLCETSLVGFPGALKAGPNDLVHISVNLTLHKFGDAFSASTEINNWDMDALGRSAYDDCLELLDDSIDLLSRSLFSASADQIPGGTTEDVMTWLSAAITNQDTCTDGLEGVTGPVKDQMGQALKDLTELVSNSLAIYASTKGGSGGDFAGVPIQNRRRLLSKSHLGHPMWMSESDRILLATPSSQIQADVVVAKDGSGTVKTIQEAIKLAPEKSDRRFIIHIKAGTYEEKNLKTGRKKTNLWFIGDGKGQTVITGSLSVGGDKVTTFHTASFAATGNGFVAKDITFENTAGAGNHQAVALRVGADHAAIYRCEIKGYQDTLYAHSQRQFYRECDIYGTVDFIFGNAAVVFQSCNIYARKPMGLQKNTITAQNRKDPNQNTGISIHACQIRPTADLEASKSSFPTYLGRPWKAYSRVVYMLSYIGDHVDPQGWLEWNATSPVDKLYYGEYKNFGPGSDTAERVKWPGVHVSMSMSEANQFTVAQFILGSSWLASTGVAFQAGLSG